MEYVILINKFTYQLTFLIVAVDSRIWLLLQDTEKKSWQDMFDDPPELLTEVG